MMKEIFNQPLKLKLIEALLPKIFGASDETLFNDFLNRIEWIHINRGSCLIRQGDPGDCLYIVISGRLRATVKSDDGSEKPVGDIRRGESVGEMSLLTGEERSASIYAVRDSELIRLSKDDFENVIDLYPRALKQITRTIIYRLKNATACRQTTASETNIALVPLSPAVPLTEFASRLSFSLKAHGPVLHLNSAIVDSFFNTPGISQADEQNQDNLKLEAWLDEQEAKNSCNIYEADLSPTAWSRRCVRLADEILLVGCAGENPEPGETEQSLLSPDRDITSAGRTLVLLTKDEKKLHPGTRSWMDARRIDHHQHVRLNSDADFMRLVRILTGKSVGLVLGGGGARGFAHIGVIRALNEAGVPIDIIGGTSMGAVVASHYAMGMTIEEMTRVQKDLYEKDRPFKDYTIPVISLYGSKRLESAMKRLYGSAHIEDLWLRFFCVSTNLTQAETVIHRSGLLWKAVRTSLSLPGVLPPVTEKGNLLVDGCVLNNLPGDIMKNLYGGTVIVVNVNPKEDAGIDSSIEEFPSPWKILWHNLFPRKKKSKLPNIFTVLTRANMLGSIRQAKDAARTADYYLEPPISRYGIMEFEAIEEIVDVGYQYAGEKIDEWKRGGLFNKLQGSG
ncbi:MAG: cyclic nucleotide-binding and patatin-like phospholipase domain-containing protein [Desulfobacterales bacterium]|nr:cyclic nucleotide-binding and patatin-like phospholipase domain-containing protein [Desulfobacterales bacterium]